jgi:hypothetical protein
MFAFVMHTYMLVMKFPCKSQLILWFAGVVAIHSTLPAEDEEDTYHQLTPADVDIVLSELREWAISWDGRSRTATYTSIVLSPKIASLPDTWQSPERCLLLGEMEGNDHAKNLQKFNRVWAEIGRLYRGEEKATFDFDGQTLELKVRLGYIAIILLKRVSPRVLR